jgi:hypothetical protein
MPIHRTSIEATVPMTTKNELTNGDVKSIRSIRYNLFIFFRNHKRQI